MVGGCNTTAATVNNTANKVCGPRPDTETQTKRLHHELSGAAGAEEKHFHD